LYIFIYGKIFILYRLCRTSDGPGLSGGSASVTAGCNTVTFAPSDTTQHYDITLANDNVGEESKTFSIYLENNDQAVTLLSGGPSYTVVTLQDDDSKY
jgi:hypothetical protein